MFVVAASGIFICAVRTRARLSHKRNFEKFRGFIYGFSFRGRFGLNVCAAITLFSLFVLCYERCANFSILYNAILEFYCLASTCSECNDRTAVILRKIKVNNRYYVYMWKFYVFSRLRNMIWAELIVNIRSVSKSISYTNDILFFNWNII